jgi:hypothetical protein
MECEKVRDRFSSYQEGGLNSYEEKVIREHLSSCSACQKDYGRFDQTIRWLHSVGEEEVPEGFLPGIYKKMEDQKGRNSSLEKARSKWFLSPLSFRIPIQAVAMVSILFLVLYITKMMPVDAPDLKDEGPIQAPLQTLPQIEGEKEKPSAPQEKKREKPIPSKREEEVRKEVKAEREEEILSPKPKKMPTEGFPPPEPPLAAQPLREIILKVSDREKVLLQLDELLKQWGGEIVNVEGNTLLASIPTASVSELEKELGRWSLSGKEDRPSSQKDTLRRLSAPARIKKEEVRGKGQGDLKSSADRVNSITIRILLLPE